LKSINRGNFNGIKRRHATALLDQANLCSIGGDDADFRGTDIPATARHESLHYAHDNVDFAGIRIAGLLAYLSKE